MDETQKLCLSILVPVIICILLLPFSEKEKVKSVKDYFCKLKGEFFPK
jgi:predicted Na+-dependent transporter